MALWNRLRETFTSRRNLFRAGGLAAVAEATQAAPLELTPKLYESIGVRPVINARGTFTIITGSQSLPEVKKAMEEASRHYVHLDELMEGVGKRIAEITQAEYAIVTNGCSAALSHFTAAAIAGFNPERMQRLPDLIGLRNEVIIPAYSRNQYDHAIRMLGVKVIEVREFAELEPAINSRTALIYILAGPKDDGPLGTAAIAPIAGKHNVPLIVDAAAEVLTIPNVHLARGATAVAYSGGKCIRGPQAAGLLLGDKAMLQAAWINSAPHHAFGRSMKVGKEEIMGMLAAVEMWPKRDHKAEWSLWEERLGYIASRLQPLSAVTTTLRQPSPDLSNRTPALRVEWDLSRLNLSGQTLAKQMLDREPRIVVANPTANSIQVVPYMLMPGEEKIIATKLHGLLANPQGGAAPASMEAAAANLSGQWDVQLDFGRGSAMHTLVLEQDGNTLLGTHRGEFDQGNLTGTVSAQIVRFRSSIPTLGSRIAFEFSGKLNGNKLEGTVNLGEYGQASFSAERHRYA
ncbi:MAG: selenocysteine synthase [Acidobacteria bacterium]|nr:selenocysteine synthase [Acidobacteriota bacterium]